MKITKELLASKGACSDGAKAFNRFFPNGFDLAQWTPEFQLRIIKQTRLSKYIGWAYENGLIPLWSMTSANLTSANLTSADLRWANLRWANLIWADLRWANLTSANLTSANLIWADLRWANLTSANLTSADLRWANLTSANLTSAYYSKYTVLPENFDAKSAGMLWVEV